MFELDRQGRIVWQVDTPRSYEAERLNTGDESTGGPSAVRAGIESRTRTPDEDQAGALDTVRYAVRGLFPDKLVNGFANVTPTWMGLFDLVAMLATVLATTTWAALELWWADVSVRSPVTRH